MGCYGFLIFVDYPVINAYFDTVFDIYLSNNLSITLFFCIPL